MTDATLKKHDRVYSKQYHRYLYFDRADENNLYFHDVADAAITIRKEHAEKDLTAECPY